MSIGVFTIGTESITSTPQVQTLPAIAIVSGREYRLWLDFPDEFSDADLPLVDFIVARVPSSANALGRLPIGSLTRARFYYGSTTGAFGAKPFTVVAATDVFTISGGHGFFNDDRVLLSDLTGAAGVVAGTIYFVRDRTSTTFKLAATQGGTAINITTDGSGDVALVVDDTFRPLWAYPVSIAMCATPWGRWGAGNRWRNGVMTPDDSSQYGFANDVFLPHVRWSPAIGLMGEGTCIIGMELHNQNARLDLPFPTKTDRWLFHYSEIGNVPQNDMIDDIEGGPMNPAMILAHQDRIVIPDRRRTAGALATVSTAVDHGFLDDLLFYSDALLPIQNFLDPPLATDRGIANTAYGEFPAASMLPYNRQLFAADALAGIGAIGVVTIDQLLLIKHRGGGVLIAGDMDDPSQHRLPYLEPTGGLVAKGVHTPIGFVYGTPNGIYAWQGGDTSIHLSPQLDGFFWDHTDGSEEETYAGQRGRFGYWQDMIFVPNGYVYDLTTESWWKLNDESLFPVSAAEAPYNCYDVDENNILYAFPYRHAAPDRESHADFPAAATGLNALTFADEASFSAPAQLDIRYAVDDVVSGSGTRTIASQWQATGDQRSYLVRLDTTHHLQLLTSTDGTALTAITATCDVALTAVDTPMLGRVTWRSSDGRVQFFAKAPGEIRSQLDSHQGWTQLGLNETAAVAQLHNSTDALVLGNLSSTVLADPYVGNIYAFSIATTIDGTPVKRLLPANFPVDESATVFLEAGGGVVNVVRAGAGPALTLDFIDQTTPPAWYTFDSTRLTNQWLWESLPLIETRGRVLSFQTVEVVASSQSTEISLSTLAVTLRGYDESGTEITSPRVELVLGDSPEPQLLRTDIEPNFTAAYVRVELHAFDDFGNPGVKVHSVKFGVKERAKIPRFGGAGTR